MPTASLLPTDLATKVHQIDEAIEQFNANLYKPAEDKDPQTFRNYSSTTPERVAKFYAEQHAKQTVAFNIEARETFLKLDHARLGIWEALELLNELHDDSDPDTELSQIEHCIQTAEAIRKDGHPRWMQLTGLIHDLGKLLAFFGAKGQYEIVGDTFVVGCAYSERCVFPEFFRLNPDHTDERYNTINGIYKPGCGLDNVMLSWGHDEYMYHVCKTQSTLPPEALAIIRYHSAYPIHREGAYGHLLCDQDEQMLKWVRKFNPYDLYSKSDDPPSPETVKPYYQELISEFFPDLVDF